jgi:hypothetical protein
MDTTPHPRLRAPPAVWTSVGQGGQGVIVNGSNRTPSRLRTATADAFPHGQRVRTPSLLCLPHLLVPHTRHL